MCTLAFIDQPEAEIRFMIAANRDEFFHRPALGPHRWADRPNIFAGRDLSAGGTWFGYRLDDDSSPNEDRLLCAAVLNRRAASDAPPARPGRRSRGALPLLALDEKSVDEAADKAMALSAEDYGGFSLLLVGSSGARVVDNVSGFMRRTKLEPGLSLLTNLDINDTDCPRLASARRAFAPVLTLLCQATPGEGPGENLGTLVAEEPFAELKRHVGVALADHSQSKSREAGNDSMAALSQVCVHTEHYGTRSSILVVVRSDGSVYYFYSPGPPCRHGFKDVLAAARTG